MRRIGKSGSPYLDMALACPARMVPIPLFEILLRNALRGWELFRNTELGRFDWNIDGLFLLGCFWII